MSTRAIPSDKAITLGILAGGRAIRLGGRDKAWLQRNGVAQVVMLETTFAQHVDAVIVSANRNQEHYLSHGLRAVHDRVPDIGPLGGLDALVDACRTPWLLTLPVDLLHAPDDLIDRLLASGAENGAVAEDDDGPQPLVALWHCDALGRAAAAAILSGDHAIHALQTRLGMARVRFEGVRFGNLNTPDDLAAAGIDAA